MTCKVQTQDLLDFYQNQPGVAYKSVAYNKVYDPQAVFFKGIDVHN